MTQTEKLAEQAEQAAALAGSIPSYDDEDQDDEEAEEQPEPVKLLNVDATFDHIVVWSHDQLPAADDAFVKGIEEWVSFAKAVSQDSLYLWMLTDSFPDSSRFGRRQVIQEMS